MASYAIGRLLRRMLATRRLRRQMLAAPLCALGDVPESTFARVVGSARPLGPVLEAPLSHRICVYYAIVGYDYRNDGTVVELALEREGLPFAIAADDRSAVIDPAHATISLDVERVTSAHGYNDATVNQKRVLDRHHPKQHDWRHTRVFEFCEAIIELDQRIAVVGTCIHEPDPDAPRTQYRDDFTPPMRPRFASSAAAPLIVTDDAKVLRAR